MRLFNWVLIVLTVNDIVYSDSTIATSTMNQQNLVNSSCTLYSVTDMQQIKSSCGNQSIYLHFNNSHFDKFPRLFDFYQNLQSIDMQHAGIQHIDTTTFDNAVHLTTLDIEGSKINTLQNNLFTHLNNLTSFDLSNSSIKVIEKYAFQGLSNLQRLDLSWNHIRGLEAEIFQPLTRLQTLRLNNNEIEVIDGNTFQRNLNLRWVYLTSNKIISVDPNSFIHSQLKSLDLEFNQLEGIDLSTLKYLSILNVGNNKLNTLIVPYSVTEIHAQNNSIAVILSEPNNALDRLVLASNHLVNLRNLTVFGKLQFLDLASNQLQNINFADFKNITGLKELKLSGNQLSTFEPSNLITNLPKLKMIELSTKHWPADYTIKLNDELKKRGIILGRDPLDNSDTDGQIVTPVSPTEKPTIKPTDTTKSSNNGNDANKLEEIDRRLNDVEQKIESNAATNTKEINDRLSDMHKNIEDKMTQTNAANNIKYDAMISTLKTYEALVIIMFIAGLMFVLYKVIIYSKNMLNGMRYRRAQSHDPIFSEQDL